MITKINVKIKKSFFSSLRKFVHQSFIFLTEISKNIIFNEAESVLFINQNLFIMKKSLLLLVLVMTLLYSATAGYIVKGINVYGRPEKLQNFTLTIDGDNRPISAASMWTNLANGGGLNTIVILDPILGVPAIIFPIRFLPDERYDIEVRDFHYDRINRVYVLCGSRTTLYASHAFVAVIDRDFLSIDYIEHPEVDVYYSISIPNIQQYDYYVCGKIDSRGMIGSVSRSSLRLTNFYTTSVPWEYHKIIAKYDFNAADIMHFVVSGRNPDCSQIGFTTLDPLFNSNTYTWFKNTEKASHVVVCELSAIGNRVVLASSFQNTASLYPVTFPVSPFVMIDEYLFNFGLSPSSIRYCIQDIGLYTASDVARPGISVAGYVESDLEPVRSVAWHGSTQTTFTTMTNNYFGEVNNWFKHYKIRYNQQGREYTGGALQGNITGGYSNSALFGTPLTVAEKCDNRSVHQRTFYQHFHYPFGLSKKDISERWIEQHEPHERPMPAYFACTPFKGDEGEVPEFAMPPSEKENEIITFPDRITIKDIPTNIAYQIYSVTGQLIQTGATSPDISTLQLSKGMYILRLENGKAYKFIK